MIPRSVRTGLRRSGAPPLARRSSSAHHSSGKYSDQPKGSVPPEPTACTETVIWQLPILPSVPEYCRFTPGECLPCFAIPVSSTTQASTPISRATRSAQARTTSSGRQGESARNYCTDS